MKLISTSSLSKTLEVPAKELFVQLTKSGLIVREDDTWALTDKGKSAGGEYKESKQYGRYIVWPENLEVEALGGSTPSGQMLTSTAVGEHFGFSANKINFVLSELGWLKKGELKGWVVTEQGKKQQKGVQAEDYRSGIPYARWPESILESKALKETVSALKGGDSKEEAKPKPSTNGGKTDFREKFEAKHRAADGHFVRSKAEMLIDNWLYMAEIVHAYERKLPIEEDVYCDFYIPTGKVYIEYWGYENDPKYLNRKKEKQRLYEKYGFNLIELEDKDVQNLDDILPRMLLKYGVQAY